MPKHTFVIAGRVEKGGLVVSRPAIARTLREWPDGPVLITFRREGNARSLAQLHYYWGVCVSLVSEHTGYDPEDVHDIAKQILIPHAVSIADRNGVIVDERVIGGSIAGFDVGQMSEYIDRFRRWAAETLQVETPDPSPKEERPCGHPTRKARRQAGETAG